MMKIARTASCCHRHPLIWVLCLFSVAELCKARSDSKQVRMAFCDSSCRNQLLHRHAPGSISVLFSSSLEKSPEKKTITTTRAAKPATKPMSVAVVGAGAVGSYYGARLWESGHDVKYLFRNENYHAATRNGLNVTSVYGDIYIPGDELQAFDNTNEIGQVDWVLVALKSTSLDAIPDLIYPLLDPDRTRVLVIMNGLIEEDLIRMLKQKAGEDDNPDTPLECCKTLYGGMALVCSNQVGPAVVHHSYAGLLTAGVASSRSLLSSSEQDRDAFVNMWADSKIEISYEPCLLRGRWRKMIWNLPFNGISVAMGGITIDRVVGDPSLRKLAYAVMDETIAVANADLENMYGKGCFEPLGDADKHQMMALSDGMGPYKTSTMLDLVNRRSMEVDFMFRKPVGRAQKLGIPVPHLETLVAQIEAFQRHFDLF